MPNISANITGNIGIKTGNFSLSVAFFDNVEGFTDSDITMSGTITGVSFTITGSGKDYHLNFTLPEATDQSSFSISFSPTSSVTVGSEECSIEGNPVSITYDTTSEITADITDPALEIDPVNDPGVNGYDGSGERLVITIQIDFMSSSSMLHTELVGLSKTDFHLLRLDGDPIHDFDYYLRGSGFIFELVVIPQNNRYGRFQVDMTGHVLKADGITNEIIVAHAIDVEL